ncbi:MAG TPA: hypothetical protein VHV55_19040 [Pirellulales bacterium]|jgi:hypothetical protein|nr:hypothetical protein [Pirellulales bacterium]
MVLNDALEGRPGRRLPIRQARANAALRWTLAAAGMLLLAGCGGSEHIDHYSTPKPEAIDRQHGIVPGEQQARAPAEPVPTRMLAAVVLHARQGWFFKLTGPPKAIEDQATAFRKFVESLHFVRSLPKWELPSGWREEPGTAMRFATIRVPSAEHSLELSVINLPNDNEDKDQYLLANINRWRSQLGLPPTVSAELPKQITTLKLKEGEASLVDFEGEMASGGGMGGPFAGRRRGPFSGDVTAEGRAPHPPMTAETSEAGGEQPAEIHFDTPPGWKQAPAGGMRKAAFDIGDPEKHALVTVIDLGSEAGGLLANVNRWRGQLQLPEISEDELHSHVKQLPVDEKKGQYIELFGLATVEPRQGTLAVMVEHGGKNWFVKLSGDASIVRREKPHFEHFVKSLHFGEAKGASNGN